MRALTTNDMKNLTMLIEPHIKVDRALCECFNQICDNYDKVPLTEIELAECFYICFPYR